MGITSSLRSLATTLTLGRRSKTIGQFSLLAVISLISPVAYAEDNVGSCGWGSKLFEGDKGVAPQVLAVTTNGFTGSQTVGISSGTSGCTRNGVVRSNWHSVQYIEENKTRLAEDISRGNGDSLDGLATVLGITEAPTRALFKRQSQLHFAEVFPATNATGETIAANLKRVMSTHPLLAPYSIKL